MITIKPFPKSYLDLIDAKAKIYIDDLVVDDLVVGKEKTKTLKVFSKTLPIIKLNDKVISRVIDHQCFEYNGGSLRFYLDESRITSGDRTYVLEALKSSLTCSKYKVFFKKKEIGTITDKISLFPFKLGTQLSFQPINNVFDRGLGLSLLVMYIEAERYYRELV